MRSPLSSPWARRLRGRALLCFLLLGIGAQTLPPPAFAAPNLAAQQRAEEDRQALRLRIQQLRQEISQNLLQQNKTKQLARTTRQSLLHQQAELSALESTRDQMEKQAALLAQNLARLSLSITTQKNLLSQLVKPHLIAQQQGQGVDVLKHLLDAPSLNEFARRANYFSYFERAQLTAINTLQANKISLDETQAENAKVQQKLLLNHQLLTAKVNQLGKLSQSQTAQLNQLGQTLQQQQQQIKDWQQAEKKLSQVITQIAQAIARAQLKEKKARDRELARTNKHAKPPAKNAPLEKAEQANPAPARHGFSGTIGWPVSGPISAHFGELTVAGIRSRGLFFDVPVGAEVKAVAAGRVVFAEALKGFGQLLIIDHGDQLMSVYSNNQSLVLSMGAQVTRGQTVAKAGSGNQSLYSKASSGLYFETRLNGRAVNPMQWLPKP